MTEKSDRIYLLHILDCITKIEKYLKGVEKEEFDKNTLIQDGVIRQLEIIGEAVKNISKALKENNNHLPWQDMASIPRVRFSPEW